MSRFIFLAEKFDDTLVVFLMGPLQTEGLVGPQFPSHSEASSEQGEPREPICKRMLA